MKKFLLISTLLMSTLVAVCQEKEDEDTRMNGIRFGYQRSDFTGSNVSTSNNLDTWYVGIVRQKKLSPLFRLETGLEFMLAGSQVANDTKVELSYIVVPVQLHIKLGPFIGTGGINAAIKVHQKSTVAGVDVTDASKVTTMDCPVDLGVGFKLWILTAEVRYYYGLVDIKDGWHNNYVQAGSKVGF